MSIKLSVKPIKIRYRKSGEQMFKLKFEMNFLIFLKDLKKILKSDIYDKNTQNETLRTPALKYIASVKNREQLINVEALAKRYEEMSVHKFENEFMEAVYIDSNNDYNALFLAVQDDYLSLDSEKLNYGNDSRITSEIQKSINEQGLSTLADFGFDTTVNILYAFQLSIAKYSDISMDELEYIKMSNTQKEFVKCYSLYRDHRDIVEAYDFDSYDHLKSFSLNYYAMIKVMSDVYKKEESSGGFTIQDAGTSNSQLAMMLSTLKEDELMGLNVKDIIASDLYIGCQDKTFRYLSNFEEAKNIQFVQQDFTDESKELPQSDVTILNDVLEHFPTDELSFHILERFWKSTRKLLIVHVPQEDVPDAQWGHYITFNKEKLESWAKRLPGHISLGDSYSFNENKKYSDCGFLILKK
ncbi:MAG TPA: hypothetical protein VF941_10950 [Clostridia bacterium]